ncbi:hypothetical protein DSECCO2_25870 [anaerobic digester metagenome]
MASKTPNGFRAVRYCDSHRIYYVFEHRDGCFKATSEDGKVSIMVEPEAFKKLFCREHHPDMPLAVRTRFEGKPAFSEWWAVCRK